MPVRYTTTLSQVGNNTGIEVPPDVLEALGGGKRPRVVVVANGFVFRTSVGAMNGRAMLPFSADRRRESGLAGGDDLDVEIALDDAPVVIEVPDDLAAALDDAGVRATFDALAPSRRKAHVTSVEGAKAAETRTRRIAKVVDELVRLA